MLNIHQQQADEYSALCVCVCVVVDYVAGMFNVMAIFNTYSI